MYGDIFIETKRLIVKTLNEKDFCVLRLQQKDPDFMEFFGGPREDRKINLVINKLYKHLQEYGFSQGLVIEKESREIIGRAGLVYLDFKGPPDVELGYFLLKPYWGRGFATELGQAFIQYAFEKLGSPRVYATVDPNNIASERVSEKLGMSLERIDTYTTLGKPVKYYVRYKDK